jgi:alkanesulfonate monooxygenase SsuD/methylene tetrahydromethanopterin reductase-like flavin-dependent oxidoreductase (luciferase family)
MRVGVVILPELRWPEAQDIWRRAEALGFDHGWTYDHLAWRSLRESAWFGAVPTLAAAALVTERMLLGPLVASPNFRHPVPFSKEVVTLDDLSGGRLILGIGAGAYGWDTGVLGQEPLSPGERFRRFSEFVELTDMLLRRSTVSYTGRFFCADGAVNHPGCRQQPRVPFAIAATGPRGIRLAARFADIWVTTGEGALSQPAAIGDSARVVRDQIGRFEEACVEVGRDPSAARRLVLTGPLLEGGLTSPESFRDAVGRYAEAGVDDLVVHWPRPSDPYQGDLDVFERVCSTNLRPT